MPYVDEATRRRLHAERLPIPMTSGELNFLITAICDKYISSMEMRYTGINTVIGALECAKLEFYRRLAAPYEDTKKAKNGDVYHGRHSARPTVQCTL